MGEFEKIEESLKLKVDSYLDSKIRKSRAKSNRASELGFPCDNYQVLLRLEGKPRRTIAREKVFRMGTVLETPNMRLLQDAGISLRERIDEYTWPKYNIEGWLDAWVEVPELTKDKIPLEHKTCSPQVFKSVLSFRMKGESLTQSKYIWLRKYPGQLMIYCLLKGTELGLWFFFEKSSGDYFFWVLKLDYEYSEELIQRAERVENYVAKHEIPKAEYKSVCPKCDFNLTRCFVGKDYGEGFEFVDSDELEAKIKRYLELEVYDSERKELHSEIIGERKKPGLFYGKNVVIGNYKVTSKKSEFVYYQVPEEIRKDYIQRGERFITEIEELQSESADF